MPCVIVDLYQHYSSPETKILEWTTTMEALTTIPMAGILVVFVMSTKVCTNKKQTMQSAELKYSYSVFRVALFVYSTYTKQTNSMVCDDQLYYQNI